MKTKKFGEVDPATGKKWGGSPLTHWRYLKRAVERGSIDIPCGDCSACCRSGVPIYEDDGTEISKRADGACIHLQADGKCERHRTRPEHCRLFTCTLMSIAGVVTDSALMNEALAKWEWDLSKPEDREFAEQARRNEARITEEENAAEV
ncbi:MAG: hypothetical protein QF893_04350 [Alphaproteobacteria bacterium]|jgi:hypothetical protein|nr:hypothetical protein [Alphaproteobacteria bacterium]